MIGQEKLILRTRRNGTRKKTKSHKYGGLTVRYRPGSGMRNPRRRIRLTLSGVVPPLICSFILGRRSGGENHARVTFP